MTPIPAHPYFRPKSEEHDVTLTSLMADLTEHWRIPLVRVCAKFKLQCKCKVALQSQTAKFGGDISFRFWEEKWRGRFMPSPIRAPFNYRLRREEYNAICEMHRCSCCTKCVSDTCLKTVLNTAPSAELIIQTPHQSIK